MGFRNVPQILLDFSGLQWPQFVSKASTEVYQENITLTSLSHFRPFEGPSVQERGKKRPYSDTREQSFRRDQELISKRPYTQDFPSNSPSPNVHKTIMTTEPPLWNRNDQSPNTRATAA
ncbi:uncharacterized protein PADG_03100 [Paracoccidioides brasiliensis Pb18]|uniref:Uncharacterized protein n=2 Tax=Paracoccidioides brasiliensis TaxID=121759 RepID=C1G7E5_PARBD|nr:uncharacterized protein PADG_03100 [Paracoccidioides brasiliensis Pb18]EEH47002.2 hypothetical protein PADG_03100 [Paracoccidioides brasiliensis Pb18]ODH21994.1 hypothetical protein ACO22_05591 [Paracoccidioides brasiliensis]